MFILNIVWLGLISRTATSGPEMSGSQIIRHDTNRVEICISNYGKFGPGWWPRGTGQNYIFGAGLWLGTVDSITGDTLVSIGYGPHGGESEFAPGLQGMDPQHPCAVIYINPEKWPAPHDTFPMAPQALVSHEDSWCCYNDCDSVWHMPGDGRPIGIEVYQTGYEWARTEIQDVFFMTYEFKNVSGHSLNDCYIGIVIDNDFQSGTNGILERIYNIGGVNYLADNIGYQWGDETACGVIGFDLLQTPFDLVSGCDKDCDGIPDQYERDSVFYSQHVPPSQWDADQDLVPDWRDASENPQKGMTALKRFSMDIEPNRDTERYLTLAGYNYRTGEYVPFDTLDPWVPPWDERMILSTGPLTILPDSVVTFVFAVMLCYWHDIYATPDTALVLVDHWAQRWYDMSWFRYTGIEERTSAGPSLTRFTIQPNPVHGQGMVRFGLPHRADVRFSLFDVMGRRVRTIFHGGLDAGIHDLRIDINQVPAGSYFLIMDRDGYTFSRQLVVF